MNKLTVALAAFFNVCSIVYSTVVSAESYDELLKGTDYSRCLDVAVAEEKKREIPDLGRVQSACFTQYSEFSFYLPPSTVSEVMARLNSKLERELIGLNHELVVGNYR